MRRVVSLPQVTLSVEGVLMSQQEGRGLSQVIVQQALSVPGQCELTFEDPRGRSRYPPGSPRGRA